MKKKTLPIGLSVLSLAVANIITSDHKTIDPEVEGTFSSITATTNANNITQHFRRR